MSGAQLRWADQGGKADDDSSDRARNRANCRHDSPQAPQPWALAGIAYILLPYAARNKGSALNTFNPGCAKQTPSNHAEGRIMLPRQLEYRDHRRYVSVQE
jgi:hypothetical protein